MFIRTVATKINEIISMKYIDRFSAITTVSARKKNLFTFYTLLHRLTLHHQKVYFSISNCILNAPSLTTPINKIINRMKRRPLESALFPSCRCRGRCSRYPPSWAASPRPSPSHPPWRLSSDPSSVLPVLYDGRKDSSLLSTSPDYNLLKHIQYWKN